VQCGAILTVPQLAYKDKETHRPEYETIAAFGGLILNDDFNAVLSINEYLNREGVDTISAGGVVAYVLECIEKGLLKKEDFRCGEYPEGFLPVWGKAENIIPLLKLIINREGIGDVLAEGAKAASRKILGSEEFAVAAGGQELPMHDARKMPGLMITYAADPTPGRHTAGGVDFILMGSANRFAKGITFKTGKDPEKKGAGQAQAVKFKQAFNSMGFCEFSVWCGWYPLWGMFKAITGWDISPDELLEIGWRIQTLRQQFNAREGALAIDVNKRALGIPPRTDGIHKNVTIDIEPFIKAYYKHIGFDENGAPKKETLERLGLASLN
jgi:aldehyde:ferredoxin oxidoreductase